MSKKMPVFFGRLEDGRFWIFALDYFQIISKLVRESFLETTSFCEMILYQTDNKSLCRFVDVRYVCMSTT